MITHNLIQGTPEWHAYRASHFNASDAPAMMGVSPYETRTQLMHRLHTGITPDVDAATQRRFDDGHRCEALARPLAEEIIGEDLAPVVGSLEGTKLSASFDGITMMADVDWEHKRLNNELRAAFDMIDTIAPAHRDRSGGAELPLMHRIQIEQQHIVNSDADRTLFMASEWDAEGNLVEERHCWYMPDLELRQRIIDEWAQFEIDLAAYVPAEVVMPAVAAPQMNLPSVSIQVNGSIALVDNLQAFGTALTAYVARINKSPESDQDFADLEATVKTLKNAEEALDAAENGALAQTESIDSMRRTVGLYRDTARTNRLLVEKLVKVEKENRRTKIVADGIKAFAAHIDGLNTRLGKHYMPAIAADFHGAVKGLKSMDSMLDKVNGELARAKIEANAVADKIQTNLSTLRDLAGEHKFLFADTGTIVLKAPDDLTTLVKMRISEHAATEAAKEEATRERIRSEEVERLAREQAERERNEANARAEAIAEAERNAREAAQASTDTFARVQRDDLARQEREFNELERNEKARLANLNNTMVLAVPTPVLSDKAVADRSAAAFIDRIEAKPTTPPTMSLGEISTKLGFNVTSAFLATLGFEATTVRAAKLYHEEDFPRICAALIRHIGEVCVLQAA